MSSSRPRWLTIAGRTLQHCWIPGEADFYKSACGLKKHWIMFSGLEQDVSCSSKCPRCVSIIEKSAPNFIYRIGYET